MEALAPTPVVPSYGSSALSDVVPSLAASLGVDGWGNALGVPEASRWVLLLVDGLGDLNLAEAYADQAVVMRDGRLDTLGRCQEVLQPSLIQRIWGVLCERLPRPGNQGSWLALSGMASVAEAMEGADIVTTVTADKQNATVLTDNHVGAGLHINAVGGDCPGKTELARDILLRSDIFVEYPPQTRIEGEIQQLPAEHPVIELWQVMTGETEGRKSADQITLFDSVGFAIEDFSALRYVREKIAEHGMFAELDLLADPDEPRDLYGMLLRCEKKLSAA